jgi:hypothetical protein
MDKFSPKPTGMSIKTPQRQHNRVITVVPRELQILFVNAEYNSPWLFGFSGKQHHFHPANKNARKHCFSSHCV